MPRLLVTLLCLFACTAQSFVAQTHIHVPACAEEVALLDCAATPDPIQHDGGSEPGCPLCQVALHGGGAPLAPGALAFALLAPSTLVPPDELPFSSIAAISYHWQSRGPPSS